MALLIEYYIPDNFSSLEAKWISPSERGKVIEFHIRAVKQRGAADAPRPQGFASTPFLHVPKVARKRRRKFKTASSRRARIIAR